MSDTISGYKYHQSVYYNSMGHENIVELHHCMQRCEANDERVDTYSTGNYYSDPDGELIHTEWDCLGISWIDGECYIHQYVPADHPNFAITTPRNHNADTSQIPGCYAMDEFQWPTAIPSLQPSMTSNFLIKLRSLLRSSPYY